MSYGGMAAGLAAFLLALERRQLIGAFDGVGATSPATARSREDLGLRETRLFRRLQRRGVLRSTPEGSYYLDRDGLASARRRRLGVLALVALAAIVGLAFLLMGIR